MLPYTLNMRQDATYWPPAGNDGFGGILYGSPEAVKVRWEEKSVLFRDPQGNEVMSNAVIYVSKQLEIKGQLFLGVSASSTPPVGSREIRQVGQSPDLTQTKVLHKVWL